MVLTKANLPDVALENPFTLIIANPRMERVDDVIVEPVPVRAATPTS